MSARPRPAAGGPILLILLVVVVAPAYALGTLAGAGPAALVGAFAGLFTVVLAAAGPLVPALRTMAAFVPLLLVAAIVPRLLAEVSQPAAFALITALVLLAALLPTRGPRFASAGMGLGMLTLLAYAIPLAGPVSVWQLVIATAVGLVVAFVVRVLIGLDATKATRTAVAAALDQPEPPVPAAVDAWLADRRRRWLGVVLAAAGQVQLATRSAEALARTLPDPGPAQAAVEDVRARARRVADRVRAKQPAGEADETPGCFAGVGHARIDALLTDAHTALDAADTAARTRDGSSVHLTDDLQDRIRIAVLGAGVRLRSVQLRHAVRTAFGVLLALLVSMKLPHGDPLLPTLLLTTFSILQASWRDTLGKAVPRIIGVVLGSLVTLAIVLLAPPSWLLPVAMVALVVGMATVTSRPVLSAAAMICMSVGLNASLRHLDPMGTILAYAGLTVVAVLIGVVVGFAVIPGVRTPPIAERVGTACTATVAAIRATAEPEVLTARSAEVIGAQRAALDARRDLVPGGRDDLSPAQLTALDRLRTVLDDLTALTVVAALDPDTERADILRVADELAAPAAAARGDAEEPGLARTLDLLVDEARDARATLLDA